MQYKPEIDGLRAIAVLAVVLFHFRVKAFSGGFVGVDIFFVISGYLITSIIAEELTRGTFTFRNFYARRARRILPASLVVLVAVAAFGWVKVLPSDLIVLGKSVTATVAFASNFFFLGEADYFGADSHTLHLLHTWSLALEEQFYLFFPLLMFSLRASSAARRLQILAAIAGASLVLSVVGTRWAPAATFYMLPSRMWELLAGSLVALRPPKIASQLRASCLTLLGFGLLLLSLFVIDADTPFPGIAAAAPTLGAVLVIIASPQAAAALRAVLSNRLMVGIGKVSYSMYLWHWPMAVAYLVTYKGRAQYAPLLLFPLLLLSYASYRLVEQPFRTQKFLSLKPRMALAFGTSLALALYGVVAVKTHGMIFGLDARAATIIDAPNTRHRDSYGGDCFGSPYERWPKYPIEQCLTAKPGKRNILLWGDSAAAHYLIGLKLGAEGTDINVLQATQGGCPPGLGLNPKDRPNCKAQNDGVLGYIKEHPPDLVILAGQWLSHPDTYQKALQKTVDSLHDLGLRTVVLGPAIQYTRPLPELLVQHIKKKKQFVGSKFITKQVMKMERQFKAGAIKLRGARLVSLFDLVCKDWECPTLVGESSPVQWDTHHLTRDGSILVGKKLIPIVQEELAKPVSK
jgi:peptidoglycan/LPS O-acetylase OafA/YrhL